MYGAWRLHRRPTATVASLRRRGPRARPRSSTSCGSVRRPRVRPRRAHRVAARRGRPRGRLVGPALAARSARWPCCAVPVVWVFQFTGGANPQWGGRYLLVTGTLLAVGAAVALPADVPGGAGRRGRPGRGGHPHGQPVALAAIARRRRRDAHPRPARRLGARLPRGPPPARGRRLLHLRQALADRHDRRGPRAGRRDRIVGRRPRAAGRRCRRAAVPPGRWGTGRGAARTWWSSCPASRSSS